MKVGVKLKRTKLESLRCAAELPVFVKVWDGLRFTTWPNVCIEVRWYSTNSGMRHYYLSVKLLI